MKIGIIGAGFTGLAAAYYLSSKGHHVVIFESQKKLGGMAAGFKKKDWTWPLEGHYHHIFTSDKDICDLANKVNHKIIYTRPVTSIYANEKYYQFDSIPCLLSFPLLSYFDRLRTGFLLAFFKFNPYWRPLEKVSAVKFLKIVGGEKAWTILWYPLFHGKFGIYKNRVPASWFWARIKKRSSSLGYPEAGFDSLAQSITKKLIKNKGKIHLNQKVVLITNKDNKIIVKTKSHKYYFDKLICTLPTSTFIRLTHKLNKKYIRKYSHLRGLGAVTLILVLRKKFLKQNTYWLNIGESKFPFLGLIEHTNFIDSKKYNKDNILYISNYLSNSHPYFSMNSSNLFNKYYPYIKKINPDFKKTWIKKIYVYKTPFAQPIVDKNYSKSIPPIVTPIKGIYLANIQQVYPWDRGTNYAVKLGKKVSELVDKG